MKNTALLALLFLLVAQPGWAQTSGQDIQLLESAGIKTDGPSLLLYFRQDADPKEVARLVDLLGNDSFATRDGAHKELLQLGQCALAALKGAAGHPDPETNVRIRRIRQTILARTEPHIQAAAARRLGAIKPAGTVEVLLAYLPSATDTGVIDELCSAITAVALRDDALDSRVVKCLNDPSPIKRSVAAQVLLRLKSKEHLPFIRKMLHDAEPRVRLRVGMELIAAREKEALPVLAELLGVLDLDQLWQVKAILMQVTDGRAPEIHLGGSAEYRKQNADQCAAWLSRNMNRIDLTRLDGGVDPATVGGYLKIGAVYGAWPKSDLHSHTPPGPLEDRPGFRFKFKTFPTARFPDVAVPFGIDLSRADVRDEKLEVTDEHLKELAHLKNLTTLGLRHSRVTSEGLKELAFLLNLTTLDIACSSVRDAGMRELAHLPNLRTLFLPSYLTNAGLKELAPLKNTLTELHLGYQLTGAVLKELAPLTNLTILDLRECQTMAPENLKELAPLKKLTTLRLNTVNDDALCALREIGLLHALSQAKGIDGARPRSMAEVVALDLSGTKVTEAGLKELAPLVNLSSLDLSGMKVTEAGLRVLAPLQNLTRLSLSHSSVTDASLKELAPLRNLTHIDLGRTEVTGAGLKDLACLTNLTTLGLHGSTVTDDGLKGVAHLRSLNTLILRGYWECNVTDAGLKELAPLINLTTLDLHRAKVTDAGLKHLAHLKNLTTLDLSRTLVTDARLKDLAPLKNLADLDLSETSVADAGLKDLAAHENLATLNLHDTKVTDAGLKHLTPLKNLTRISLSSEHLSDESLRVLREMNLLHSLGSIRESRHTPSSPSEVTGLNLRGTKVTDAGLKELAPLKNLTYLVLPDVTDSTLRELRGLGLLHALDLAESDALERPQSAEDVATLRLSRTKITDAGLKELVDFKNLTNLSLSGTAVTDAGLKELAFFKDLSHLDLSDTNVTGTGLKHLAGCKKLTRLDVALTDDGLRALSEMGLLHTLYRETFFSSRTNSDSELTRFDLSRSQVTDAALKELAPLKNLTELHLRSITDDALRELHDIGLLHALAYTGASDRENPKSADQVAFFRLRETSVTGAGLKYLSVFKNLSELNLAGTKVTDAGLRDLASLKNLTTLNLTGTCVTDSGLKDLTCLKDLRTLTLSDTGVTDEGLQELVCFKELATLSLTETEITDAGLKHLAGCKNLTLLYIDPTDENLRALREIGLLHAIPIAQVSDEVEGRPRTADEVISICLKSTTVTDAGLKELAEEFKNLARLDLRDSLVTNAGLKHLAGSKKLTWISVKPTDASLSALREVGLLHALSVANGEGARPTSAADVTSLNLKSSSVTDAGLKELTNFVNLFYLDLSETGVTDEGLRYLAGYPKLAWLDLQGSKVTAAGLKHLAGCRNLIWINVEPTDASLRALREIGLLHAISLAKGEGDERPRSADDVVSITLSDSKVTAAGLKELAPLKNLTNIHLAATDANLRELRRLGLLHALHHASGKDRERPQSADDVVSLNLNSTNVTDAGLKELAVFENLNSLYLYDVGVTDAGLRELASCKNLTSLVLRGTKVTDTGLKQLAPLRNLNHLALPDVTDATLQELRFIGLLHALSDAHAKDHERPKSADEVISLSLGYKVTDAGLKELVGLKNLVSLDLRDTSVTAAGVAELRKMLPKCEIVR